MDNNERCAICGDIFSGDDVKIYCPDCGLPMHKDCFDMKGQCPNSARHFRYASTGSTARPQAPAGRPRIFPDGNGCEICGKPFGDYDERVYCSDCGASMHRLCYSITHKCPYAEEHDSVKAQNDNINSASSSAPVCGKCGKDLDNGEDKVYCPICGTPVHKSCWEKDPVCPNSYRHDSGFDWDKENERSKPKSEPQSAPYGFPSITDMKYSSFSDMIKDHPIISGEDGEEMTCNGVKQEELVHFLGLNNISTPRFFTVFMNMANNGKVISPNISAWFFMPLYHFYRRMTGPAVILTLATFILTVPTLIAQFVMMNDGTLSTDLPLERLVTITSYVLIAIRFIILLFNDYIYMRWSVSKILTLRERYKDATPDEYYAALEQSGNPRFLYVLGGLSLIILLAYALSVFLNVSGMLS